MNNILILGGSGFIGYSLYKELSPFFKTFGTFYSNINFKKNKHFFKYDIGRDDIEKLLTKLKPNVIISSLRGPFENQIILHNLLISYSEKFNFKLFSYPHQTFLIHSIITPLTNMIRLYQKANMVSLKLKLRMQFLEWRLKILL